MRHTWYFTLVFLSLTLAPATHADRIRVGVSLPLTGPASTYGTDIRNILEFLRDSNPSSLLDFEYQDDKCDPKEAVSVAQKFTAIERFKVVTGLPCSGTVLATAPLYERQKVVAVSIGAGAPKISSAGEYIFRARPSDVEAAVLLARFISKKAIKVAVVAEEAEMPQGLADAFAGAPASKDLKISRESFASDTTDFGSLLVKIQSGEPEALLFFTQTERSSISFVEGVRKLKMGVPLYTAIFPGSPSFLNVAKANADDIVFATLRMREGLNADGKEMLSKFEKKYGPLVSVDYLFPVTVAAFRALDTCVRESDVQKCLYSKPFEGAEGKFSFDSNGDLVGMQFVMKRIESGRAVDIN